MLSNQTTTAIWADYVISKVRYGSHRRHIAAVAAARDLGTSFDSFQPLTREQVVAMLESGFTFCTVELSGGKWHRGANVKVVMIHGVKYIKTVNDGDPGDNLGNLPTF